MGIILSGTIMSNIGQYIIESEIFTESYDPNYEYSYDDWIIEHISEYSTILQNYSETTETIEDEI